MDKDIATLLGEIKSTTGWSEPRIATELGTSQPTVNRILNGQPDCKGATFRAIVDLHNKVCPQAAPTRRATDPPIEPGRAGRNPPDRDHIMTFAEAQGEVVEPKP